MSEVKLTIDEVIEHCEKKVKKYESCVDMDKIIATNGKELSFVKEYLEHKQVAEWLKVLKFHKQQIDEVLERLVEAEKTGCISYDMGAVWNLGYFQGVYDSKQIVREVLGYESLD